MVAPIIGTSACIICGSPVFLYAKQPYTKYCQSKRRGKRGENGKQCRHQDALSILRFRTSRGLGVTPGRLVSKRKVDAKRARKKSARSFIETALLLKWLDTPEAKEIDNVIRVYRSWIQIGRRGRRVTVGSIPRCGRDLDSWLRSYSGILGAEGDD